MESGTAIPATASALPVGDRPRWKVPWYCWGMVFGAASILIGVLWDISWHLTIGRDTFWTPAHLAIYLGGTLGGLCSGWIALKSTGWPTPEEQSASIRLWGFRAPLGAWFGIWGAVAMLTSAPFDDWWHNAYGLDVEILSPPHTVLAIGIYAVALGALLMMLSRQNRTGSPAGSFLFVVTGGIMLSMAAIWITEYSYPNHQHNGSFYTASAWAFPMLLVAVSRASKLPGSATLMALTYLAVRAAMIWILPLFPATPMLAPIRNPLDHMVPPPFPLLLFIPAMAMDALLSWRPAKGKGLWTCLRVVALGTAFIGLFLPVQWVFSEFLLSPAAENWFFAGNRYWSYSDDVGPWTRQFWDSHGRGLTPQSLALAWGIAVVQCGLGYGLGGWFRKVVR